VLGSALSVSASSLMQPRLSASFHYVPILNDTATAYTYYGTNTYYKTAAASVQVKAYRSDGSYSGSSTVLRYGWDAVSGEGS
jgi:hypothetical protein